MIISHIVALAASAFFLGIYLKNILKLTQTLVKEKQDKRYDGFLQALKEEDQHFKHASWYFFITGLLTAGAFYLINYLPKWVTGGLVADIVSTGIHVTIILMIVSLILKFFKLEKEEKKKLLYLIALTISISFIFWDWKLGLTALCIVAGRDIWMDFLIDFKFSKVKDRIHELRTGHTTEAIIGRYCVAYMFAFMVFQLVDYVNRALGRSQFTTVLICLAPIALLGLSLLITSIRIKSFSKARERRNTSAYGGSILSTICFANFFACSGVIVSSELTYESPNFTFFTLKEMIDASCSTVRVYFESFRLINSSYSRCC